jgi:catechol 2,3-dioxygenase-like lactoylglutathione lyase family enzyme
MPPNAPSTAISKPGPTSHIRIARPTHDFTAAERFYVAGLGLSVLWRSTPDAIGGHALVMLGWPGAAWHLELVLRLDIKIASSEEDLLVIYADGEVDEGLVERLVASGGRRVTNMNPYWEECGVTVVDPDGYRLVLCRKGWSNVVGNSAVGEPAENILNGDVDQTTAQVSGKIEPQMDRSNSPSSPTCFLTEGMMGSVVID